MRGDPPVSRYARCAGREIHYLEWGAPDLPPVIAWHGLARVGVDFDPLARALAGRWRTIAPDTIGRGLSQWAADAGAEYNFAFYERIVLDLCDRLGVGRMRWIGTSMGGSLGMYLAGGALRGRIERLVVNDIGPELPRPAMERIAAYLGAPPAMDTVGELERYLREVYAPFGRIPDAQWRAMAEASFRRLPDGRVTTHYDPRIAGHFAAHPGDWRLWARHDAIAAPTLLLRGADSDLLSRDMAAEMARRGPRARLVEFPDCGHAPALADPAQIDAVARFLAE